MKKESGSYAFLALAVIVVLLGAVLLADVVTDVEACIDTYGGDLNDCNAQRESCYQGCNGSSACEDNCDSSYNSCTSNAAIGGPLGIPQGFNPCVTDATVEEAIPADDSWHVYKRCTNMCAREREDCLARGDAMNPTPEGWDQMCYEMGIECSVECDANVPPNSF